jgi:hypothetical protein
MLEHYQQAVASRLDAGSDLQEIDDELITPAVGLSDDERAALWLFAWSRRESGARAQHASGPLVVG